MATSKTTISKEKAHTSLKMVVYTKEIGSMINCTARVFTSGQMGAATSVNTKMARRMDKVFQLGLMGEYMTANGNFGKKASEGTFSSSTVEKKRGEWVEGKR